MELLLYAGIFYAWQCLELLPADAVIFSPRWWRPRVLRGGGWRLLHPWPGASSWVSQGLPFSVSDRGVVSVWPVGWRNRPLRPPKPRLVTWGQLADASATGRLVRLNGAAFLRAASPRHAVHLAAVLHRLGVGGGERRQRLETELQRTLDGNRAAERVAEARSATRWLDFLCSLYALALALILPAFMLLRGEWKGFLLLAPSLLVIHLLATFCIYRAHRRLQLGPAGERWELILAAALFPPALLRAPQELRSAAVAEHHPAALASVVLTSAAFADYLRYELALLARCEEDGELGWEGEVIEAQLVSLGEEAGISRTELLATRPRDDPSASGYCPLCLGDYRRGVARCRECQSRIVAYGTT